MPNAYRQGDHICTVYDGDEQQVSVASEYLADGLRRGERCLYVAGSRAQLARFHAAVGSRGIDADDMVRSGALVEQTNAEVHLVEGRFDCERMLAMLNEAVEAALGDGFTGLRTCGDMSWLLDEPEGSHRIVEYEALLNGFFRGIPALGMCTYDSRRLPPGLVDHALATHPLALVDGHLGTNPFYEVLDVALRRVAQPSTLGWKIDELRRRA